MTQRYKEDPLVRSMRVRTWFHAVSMLSGLTVAQLECQFAQVDAKGSGSCIWDKYRRGEVVPRSRCSNKWQLSLVERVERRYPGTTVWLSSPLWRLADKAPMDMGELRRTFAGMPGPFRALFIADDRPSALFWRRPVDTAKLCDLLMHANRIEAPIVLLALAKEAEVTQNQEQHQLTTNALRENLAILTAGGFIPERVRNDLSSYLQLRWRAAKYPR